MRVYVHQTLEERARTAGAISPACKLSYIPTPPEYRGVAAPLPPAPLPAFVLSSEAMGMAMSMMMASAGIPMGDEDDDIYDWND